MYWLRRAQIKLEADAARFRPRRQAELMATTVAELQAVLSADTPDFDRAMGQFRLEDEERGEDGGARRGWPVR